MPSWTHEVHCCLWSRAPLVEAAWAALAAQAAGNLPVGSCERRLRERTAAGKVMKLLDPRGNAEECLGPASQAKVCFFGGVGAKLPQKKC